MSQLFETFDLNEKMEELKVALNDKELACFKGKRIVVAVPSFDESVRHIQTADPELYNAQIKDAEKFVKLIDEQLKFKNNTAESLDTLSDSKYAASVVDKHTQPVDYLILLHEFIRSEKNFLVDEMREDKFGTIHDHLQVIELY